MLREVVLKCVAGASVVDLCELGDRLIIEETSKVYKKEKEMKKGEVLSNVIQGCLINPQCTIHGRHCIPNVYLN